MKTILLIIFFSFSVKAEQQFSLIGLTMHLTPINKSTSAMLKNKISAGGEFVYNLQLNYMYVNDDTQNLIHGAFLKDCFGNGAGFLAYGKRYQVKKDLYIGWELGFYGRQDPFMDKKSSGYDAPLRAGIYEFYPSPAFIVQKRISERILFRVQSNIILNSFDFALSF